MARPATKFASLLAGGVILLAALAAYHGSFSGPFVLDDGSSIAGNPTIRHLWPPSIPLTPPHGDGQTVEGRPVLNYSLALNYAISGTAVWSYHALNLAIHLLAGLTLFGVARRTFQNAASGRPDIGGGTQVSADLAAAPPALLALATALLWTLHPLQTESVTYIVQRAESLMGLFYLLTLYCFIRGVERVPNAPGDVAGQTSALGTTRSTPVGGDPVWFSLSFLACLLGMATKEVMVSAPLIVLLYDRTFIVGSVRDAWRRRRPYYLALAATWIPLAGLVVRTGNRGGTSGPDSGIAVWTYWLTQFPAVIRYLHLAVWPHPLVFDYGTEWVGSPLAVWASMLAVSALVAGTGWAFCRPGRATRAVGFLGVWFFAILAPTSLIPGNRQTAAEHRMYLALVPVVILAVVGLQGLFQGKRRRPVARGLGDGGRKTALFIFATAVFALGIGLGVLTADRNRDYRSLLALSADTVAKQPGNAFAHSNLGVVLFSLGRVPEAIEHYEQAVRLKPEYAVAHDNLGSALLRIGRGPEAIGQFQEAIRLKSDFEEAHHNLGTAFVSLGRWPEAIVQFEAALRLDPGNAETHNNFGNVLFRLGRVPEAVDHYREALRLDPGYVEAYNDLGNALSAEGKVTEAIACFETALRLNPGYAEGHYNFGNALVGAGRLADAVAQFRAAIQLRANYAAAHENLGNAVLRLDRVTEAIEQYEEALRLQPGNPVAHYNLGNAFLRLGRTPEAVAQFREALRLQPDFPQARQLLVRLTPAP